METQVTPATATSRVESVDGALVDGHGALPHEASLYDFQELAHRRPSLLGLADEDLAEYSTLGFLSVEQAFSVAEVSEALAGLTDLIMGAHPGFTGIQFERAARARLATLSLEERQDAVRKLMWFVDVEPRLAALAHHPTLLAVVRRIIDAEPVLFQDMALLKPPGGREKPWHQDKAYFDLPLGTPIVGVWIALDEATPENGCMRVRPGSHRAGPVVHFQRRDWQICDTELLGRQAEVVAAPLPPGGCLLFDGLLQHGTPYNPQPERRRAVQFHYAPADAVRIDPAARLAIFGSEGKDVEC